MGRGCECCDQDNRNCCPEDVFADSDSGMALFLIYHNTGPSRNISIEIETELFGRDAVINHYVEIGKRYIFRIIFAKEENITLDKAPACNNCSPPMHIIVDAELDLGEFFDSSLTSHTLSSWIDGIKTIGSLYCIKKYSGDPNYVYNVDSCEHVEHILKDGVYYNSANYYYSGDTWNNGRKHGCVCACENNDVYTTMMPDYEVEDNIDFTYDDCGVVDGSPNECDKIFYFTVTSVSAETGVVYVSTDQIEIKNLQAVHTIQHGDEDPYQFTHPILVNQRYVAPIARVLKPFSDTDIITVTINFMYQHIDCVGLVGCETCPPDTREKCFCFKGYYLMSPGTFHLSYIEPCVLGYDSTYTVVVNRNYRTRNLTANYTKFQLIISNIAVNFNPPFWTEPCKEAYRNFLRSLAGTYDFELDNDGCGSFFRLVGTTVIGQSTFPCACFSFGMTGDLNIDLKKTTDSINLSTCNGLAPSGDSFSDGAIGAAAIGSIAYSLRGLPEDDSGCFQTLGPYVYPVRNADIDFRTQGVPFDFAWISGFCYEIMVDINRKYSYCKGCAYTTKTIDLSAIKYRLGDLLGFGPSPTFDCDVEGVFS